MIVAEVVLSSLPFTHGILQSLPLLLDDRGGGLEPTAYHAFCQAHTLYYAVFGDNPNSGVKQNETLLLYLKRRDGQTNTLSFRRGVPSRGIGIGATRKNLVITVGGVFTHSETGASE